MSPTAFAELESAVDEALDAAEAIWAKVSPKLILEKSAEAIQRESDIPGFPIVSSVEPGVDDFIALVADIRGATGHLLQRIAPERCDVTQLQRLFFETSAAFAAWTHAIAMKRGAVTEYMGDGLLALFAAPAETIGKAAINAHDAAELCLDATEKVVNPRLANRYKIPALEMGVGLGYSQAVVTIVGAGAFRHAKVIGECVYRASRLSGGKNKIVIDDKLRAAWPESPGGRMTFNAETFREVGGYVTVLR